MMTRTGRVSAVAFVLLVLSCAGDPPVSDDTLSDILDTQEFREACAQLPTCVDPRFPVEGPTETIWRIQVVRETSGAIRFGRIDSIEVAEGVGVPLGPRTGEYVLVGLDESGESVDGQLIQFPTVARIEFEDRTSRPQSIDLSGSEVSSIGYVRALPSVETLALHDESGEAVVVRPAPSTQAGLGRWEVPPGLGLVSPAIAAGGPGGFSPNCPHVLVLNGESDRDLMGASPLGLTIELQAPGTVALANIIAALGKMTPLLCQSVSRIAFGRFSMEGAAGFVLQVIWGDMMMVNLDSGYSEFQLMTPGADGAFRRMDLQHTILHEAAHAAEALLNAEGESLRGMAYGGSWVEGARQVAKETIDQVRLAKGFAEEWRRVHDSFVSMGWAQGYAWLDDLVASAAEYIEVSAPETPSSEWTKAELAEAGFISHYAATNLADDIADSVAWTYMGYEYAREGVGNRRRDYSCIQMQLQTTKELPARLAAVYTKLQFLKDLGLVKPQDVKQCTGVNIGLPITAEGFEVWQGGTKKRSFTDGVDAVIGTKLTGTKVFKMEAKGGVGFGDTSYPATMTLHLDLEAAFEDIDEVPWPRGVYQFGSFFDGNNLMLRLDGAAAGNFDAEDGFAIVAEASNDRIVGSLFLTRALRPSAPSTLPVYQNFDPPLIIRFLMEK